MEDRRGSARRPSLYAAIKIALFVVKVREQVIKAKVKVLAEPPAIPRRESLGYLDLGSFTKFVIHNEQLSVLAMTDGVVLCIQSIVMTSITRYFIDSEEGAFFMDEGWGSIRMLPHQKSIQVASH